MNQAVATTEQPTLPGLIENEAVDRLRAELVAAQEQTGHIVLRRLPTTVERQMLQKRAGELEVATRGVDVLNKTEWARAKQVIAYTLGGFSVFQQDPSGTADIFRSHCRGLPLWAISRACEDFVHNRVKVPDGRGGLKPLSVDHPISSARLRAVAEAHVEALHRERNQIKMILISNKVERPAPTEAERKRVGELMAAWRKSLAQRALDERAEEAKAEEDRRKQDEEDRVRIVMREYASAGVAEPVRGESGRPISLKMALSLGWTIGNFGDKRVMLGPNTKGGDDAAD